MVNVLGWALGGLALIPNSLQACCSTANTLLELPVPQFSSFPSLTHFFLKFLWEELSLSLCVLSKQRVLHLSRGLEILRL